MNLSWNIFCTKVLDCISQIGIQREDQWWTSLMRIIQQLVAKQRLGFYQRLNWGYLTKIETQLGQDHVDKLHFGAAQDGNNNKIQSKEVLVITGSWKHLYWKVELVSDWIQSIFAKKCLFFLPSPCENALAALRRLSQYMMWILHLIW